MIIGNGLMAQAFAPRFATTPTVTIFASGVSNSSEIRLEQFERERQLLLSALVSDQQLVYFSTCAIYDSELLNSPYVQHKISMEKLVLTGETQNIVFRLPQVGGNCVNPHTLTNYFYNKIIRGESFQVWLNAKRNLIDVCDLVAITDYLINNHQIGGRVTNVANPFSISMLELVKIFEEVLHKTANYSTLTSGGSYKIETSQAQKVAAVLGIAFDDNYVRNLINRYYA